MNQNAGTNLPPEVLDEWLQELVALLELRQHVDPHTDIDAVLDLTRHVSHAVVRPAGPLAMFALGLLLGARVGPGEPVAPAIAEIAPRIRALADEQGAAMRKQME
ncbi:MAG TPA: DUF6457 domain-containing protein [Beutenbergiaceae bacterium]|nr:DUF6457 domain-containing protein [Beutenbergiaceae bacterium]